MECPFCTFVLFNELLKSSLVLDQKVSYMGLIRFVSFRLIWLRPQGSLSLYSTYLDILFYFCTFPHYFAFLCIALFLILIWVSLPIKRKKKWCHIPDPWLDDFNQRFKPFEGCQQVHKYPNISKWSGLEEGMGLICGSGSVSMCIGFVSFLSGFGSMYYKLKNLDSNPESITAMYWKNGSILRNRLTFICLDEWRTRDKVNAYHEKSKNKVEGPFFLLVLLHCNLSYFLGRISKLY